MYMINLYMYIKITLIASGNLSTLLLPILPSWIIIDPFNYNILIYTIYTIISNILNTILQFIIIHKYIFMYNIYINVNTEFRLKTFVVEALITY